MFFVASGRVELEAPAYKQHFETGDFFGAVAMLDNDVSHGAFRTLGRCRLLKLYKEDFLRLEHANPDIARHIRRTALERLKAREEVQAAAQST